MRISCRQRMTKSANCSVERTAAHSFSLGRRLRPKSTTATKLPRGGGQRERRLYVPSHRPQSVSHEHRTIGAAARARWWICEAMGLVSTSSEEELSELTPATRTGPRRMLFIDNIRWTMILLVLSMHATDTYSPFGNWYYTDRAKTTLTTALIFGSYQSVLQAFFMALLFFVAGFFAAPSYDRKGTARFVRDRCLRLGVPTVLYMLMIGPLTQYFLSHTWGTGGFAHQWFVHLRDGQVLSETGPMWFAAVLLVLSLLYACFRAATGFAVEFEGALPSGKAIGGFIALIACATFIVRIFIPEDVAVLNVHPGDLPQYILMFSAGIAAHRHRWLE